MLQKRPWLILVFAAVFALATAGGIIFYLERPTPTFVVQPASQSVFQGLSATVYKSPTCDCCSSYVEFLEKHGVTVNAVDTDNLAQIKADNGIPAVAQSCHTTVMDGYIIEGHVPLAALEQLFTERPEVDGIALPGMPTGTPGMPGTKQGPFEVLSFTDGQLGFYASF